MDSSRLNLSLDKCEIGIQKLTVAEETENLLHLISNISSWVRNKNDSSTKLLADLEKDLNMEVAPLKPDPATY